MIIIRIELSAAWQNQDDSVLSTMKYSRQSDVRLPLARSRHMQPLAVNVSTTVQERTDQSESYSECTSKRHSLLPAMSTNTGISGALPCQNLSSPLNIIYKGNPTA